MLRDGFLSPNRKLEKPDPGCAPLRRAIGAPREAKPKVAMSNNSAFAGTNTSLIFGRV